MARSGKKLGAWGAVLPLLGYCAVALGLPVWALIWEGIQAPDANGVNHFTFSNFTTSWHGVYLTGMLSSLRLSLLTAVISAVVGLVAAYAIAQSRGRLLKQAVLTASGVLANFGGIPLAFCFVATIGTGGVFLSWLNDAWPSFQLGTFDGLVVVYPYFLVPLMVLTTLPALDGLRRQWREAATNLGGSAWQYWRYVGGPLLLPAALGGFVLCFGASFAAYATARALSSGTVPLVTTQIASVLSGNVLATETNLGMALALNTIIVCGLMMAVYLPLRKRSAKWLES
ncbi:ABC transporter permease subunit [Actinospica durhamensis]|uniref:ABC transporter permease subunit n=1 Tax=Actinospica durhamensis TaxID=1508375 RepID=A0A941EPA6_9ACTN|nr:ABC transporter permease subunit [Actinospica durhamensis]MBR7834048.1 ABC transporter permease subunit [Actinospica durhamensis]